MFSYFLALPLPSSIRQRLASFCYGLPHVNWIEEENFHLTLRYLGSLHSQQEQEVLDHLKNLFFQPVLICLQSVGHFRVRDNQGVIWTGVHAINLSLIQLKKEIDRQLQPLQLPKDGRAFQPHVTLGRYQGLNRIKLEEYLISYADFQSEQMEIKECLLLRSRQTPKHVIYETVETYQAQNITPLD